MLTVWPFADDVQNRVREALAEKRRPERPATFPQWDEAWSFIHDRCLVTEWSERITSKEAFEELGALLKTAPPN